MNTATYSPEDNKLRLYPESRLDAAIYARVKAYGFKWAPKQELFVAPMWTPEREDLLLELCEEIGDEDKSLMERQEERSDRFQDYSANRKEDAESAHQAVSAIADGIPLGQPILVGHHSEKHARRDAERIENGMRKAVKMWEQSEYWKHRAGAAIRHAKYKERPDVRARRIKGLEADQRKQQRNKAEAEACFKFWRGECNLTVKATGEKRPLLMLEENKELICRVIGNSGAGYSSLPVAKKEGSQNWWGGWSAWDVLQPDGQRYAACPSCTVAQCVERARQHYPPNIAHYDRWIAHYDNRIAYERAMLESDGGTETDKKGPEKGGACKCWASHRGGWSYIQKVNRVSVTVLDNWGNEGDADGSRNFTRTIPFDKLAEIMTAAEVKRAREIGALREYQDKTGFYCEDVVCPDGPACPDPVCRDEREKIGIQSVKVEEAAPFKAMAETLKAGVQVVSADQLFPTPTALADRVCELAELMAGERVLEPSAGTGQLVKSAISHGIFKSDITAVEINLNVADFLAKQIDGVDVRRTDFLECNGDLGKFDKVIMNPPFSNGQDIKHIRHAVSFLNPGGRLVAICANGPRQREALEPISTEWIDLEPGAFKESGTNVNAAIVVIEKDL